ncbi:MAG: geranylgeranylglycerol-phosphate geranylgeranyltransferase [Candidatus Promineifilaceae bacterium]|nr:geranylgeranylglycerol-phosphate geranylgeranyltransferase [Candidatus Promineifilaceae bacterium]
MDQIKGLYKISRPVTTISGALAVVLGGYVAGTGNWFNIALAVLATVLVSSSANAWNDYLDVEIDKINQPARPLPSGQVSLRAAKWFSIFLAILSLIVAVFINWPSFIIVLLANLLLFVYSLKLKSTVLLGNICIAFISAMSAVAGGVAAGNPRPTLWLFWIIFVAILGREVLKTLADYDGDLSESVRTISTVWGKRTARIVFYLLVAATLIIMLIPYILQVYQPIYGYLILLGVFPVILYIALKVSRYRSGPQLEKLSQLMKYDFFLWFLAVILGSAA